MTRHLPPFLAALLLAACTTTGTQMPAEGWREDAPTPQFEASGRMGVKENERGSYANFDWLRTAALQLFEVKTPLGNSVGRLCQDSRGVEAVASNGQVYRAASTAELSQQLLGYDLPVAYLDRWANGLRVPGEPYSILPDGRLQQMGWRIQRNLDENGQVRLLHMERSGLSLRLIFDRFGQPERSPANCNDTEQAV
ncbi:MULTISPECIES: outer membrane lipoprotein LolB [Eikenella]|uniref:Outer-membrane lipoprotein LolB n=1 Tax=Eikenella longinqua TaxID=1795827 RepID=A0A1A9RXM2_9NEIS|nr:MULTISPECIES: outer membrane lipoprotein LolB [Eikenella]OAM27176.1 lipoprotein localization factor LolB [Eikenella longinqua]